MKKNLSINIRGILLYIEEDGYEVLQEYLNKINTYFANYEGNKDIVEDIESRIAEIFLSKLDSYKQVITLEDVQALITQMGDITDFEVIEDPMEQIYHTTIQEKEYSTKKLFRDDDNKVIAGVASGLAAYFGGGELIFRLLFILLAFIGGIGILIYLTLWFAVPVAKTITDKVAMKGEPITLNNIENNLKIALEDKKDDNKIVRLIMAPFRLFARILSYLQPKVNMIFKQTSQFLGKTLGIFLSGFSVLSVVTATLVALIAFRWIDGDAYWGQDVPLNIMLNSIENLNWITFFSYIGIFCLATLIFLIGLGLIFKKRFVNNSLVWGLSATSFACLVLFFVLIPQTVIHFRKDYSIEKEEVFPIDKNKVLTLTINTIEGHDFYYEDFIDVKGYEGNTIKVIKVWEAAGKNKEEALKHIEMVDYQISKKDSSLFFDNNITFKKDAKYRDQNLSLKVLIPYNQKFTFSKGFQRKTSLYSRVSYDNENVKRTWFFTSNGLECEGCNDSPMITTETYEELKKLTVDKFQEIEISGHIEVQFKSSDKFEVYISSDLAKVDAKNGTLSIISHSRDNIQVLIHAPSLNKIKLTNYAEGFLELPPIEQLNVILENHASLDISGKSNSLKVTADSFCNLDAWNWITAEAIVDLNRNSEANIHVEKKLMATARQNSELNYHGEPNVSSSVSQDSYINKQ
ncbi:MAG: PspC domain-containing protein [Raineya sp.]|jgi:phage shock protein PspC (stress-responsive transcriptional regulator)|nr:PspC domain-containing protein [Raineya sp.]